MVAELKLVYSGISWAIYYLSIDDLMTSSTTWRSLGEPLRRR